MCFHCQWLSVNQRWQVLTSFILVWFCQILVVTTTVDCKSLKHWHLMRSTVLCLVMITSFQSHPDFSLRSWDCLLQSLMQWGFKETKVCSKIFFISGSMNYSLRKMLNMSRNIKDENENKILESPQNVMGSSLSSERTIPPPKKSWSTRLSGSAPK